MNIAKLRNAVMSVAAVGFWLPAPLMPPTASRLPLTPRLSASANSLPPRPCSISPIREPAATSTQSPTSATGNAAITYRCSNGTTPVFTVPATATVTCGACTGTPTMAPTITSSNTGAGTGLGAGKDQTLTVTGTILQANFQRLFVGAITGTMTVSVTP